MKVKNIKPGDIISGRTVESIEPMVCITFEGLEHDLCGSSKVQHIYPRNGRV